MIIAANGFLLLFAKTKRRPPAGLGREFFFIVPMVIEKSNIHCGKASKTLLREGKYEQDAGGFG
jgi:hypothetical protein